MNVGKTLFTQIMEFVPWASFGQCGDRSASAVVNAVDTTTEDRTAITQRGDRTGVADTIGARAYGRDQVVIV